RRASSSAWSTATTPARSPSARPTSAGPRPATVSRRTAIRTADRRRRYRPTPDLTAVIDAWDRLPEAVRAGIVARVRAAAGWPVIELSPSPRFRRDPRAPRPIAGQPPEARRSGRLGRDPE